MKKAVVLKFSTLLIICIFFLSTDLFLNKLSSHEIEYDPVEACMNTFNGRNLVLVARVCTPDFYEDQ